MRAWWVSLLPLLICAPCLALSLGATAVLAAGGVALAGWLITPGGLALMFGAALAAGAGVALARRRRRSCRTPAGGPR